MTSHIDTKLLVLSDTHATALPHSIKPSQAVDVVVHCGDLTEESKISEFRTTLDLLKAFCAPLTLVIAGNHDWTLDLPTFRQKVKEAGLESDPALVAREYGEYGEVRQLFDDVRTSNNIHLLDEGTHRFTLANGALLTVYASPYTPSVDADWGFQYRIADGHDFAIAQGDQSPDLVLTHGPPEGVLDRNSDQKRLGCPQLFAAVARSQPRVHCFGHVHTGWGAKRVAWRETTGSDTPPTHFTAIDNGKSTVVDTLQSYRRGKFDDDDTANSKAAKLCELNKKGHQEASLIKVEGERTATEETLFINSAMLGSEDIPFHVPWVVDISLPTAN